MNRFGEEADIVNEVAILSLLQMSLKQQKQEQEKAMTFKKYWLGLTVTCRPLGDTDPDWEQSCCIIAMHSSHQ
jgi:hypothetical protein